MESIVLSLSVLIQLTPVFLLLWVVAGSPSWSARARVERSWSRAGLRALRAARRELRR